MIEGDPTVYVVEDTGPGQPGAWIDIYVEAPTDENGQKILCMYYLTSW